MDSYSLAYYAGQSDFSTNRRYIHPNIDTGRAAMGRPEAEGGGLRKRHSEDSSKSILPPEITIVN
jgi:hypothetical protein